MTMMASSSLPQARRISAQPNGFFALRSMAVGFARVLSLSLSTAYAAPLAAQGHGHGGDAPGDAPEAGGASLWVLYVASVILVLSGGAFAGLTIALMGQDGIYLQVMAGDPSEPQQKNARRVYDLLGKGKHWVLVTLLLANVIVNETLPVVLDRCLGGGVAAVVGSTFLIVIFGEVLPQSVCVRYGLQIGGYMAKPVLVLMYLLAPLAWPTAKLLDWLLGEDHGTVYKKSGLKTLVTLHKSLGEASQRLNQDEVTIISAVLDLKEKPVANVMTPMDDVFVMAEDTVLDEATMDMILSAGYSRIPIHETANPTNFVGMLLVKILITYDPEDCKLVRDFPLATLPETRPETSCLDIVNFFQEGKSHMVLVSEYPGEDHGALGVVTLEDVIEELIGEEIIDESDVYIDVHKAIRRLTPAPKARVQRRLSEDPSGRPGDQVLTKVDSDSALLDAHRAAQTAGTTSYDSPVLSSSPKTATLMMRRSSAGLDGQFFRTTVPVRTNIEEIKQHLKHLGPSNPATNPNKTRSTTVKVKPGSGTHSTHPRAASVVDTAAEDTALEEDDETTSLLKPAHLSGKDGIQALQETYGSVSPAITVQLAPQTSNGGVPSFALGPEDYHASQSAATQTTSSSSQSSQHDRASSTSDSASTVVKQPATPQQQPQSQPQQQSSPQSQQLRASSSGDSAGSGSSSLRTAPTATDYGALLANKRPFVRSGSITENVIESRGVRKVVLETAHHEEGGVAGSEEDVVVAVSASPEQPRALLGRAPFGLFARERRGEVEEGKEGKEGREGQGNGTGNGQRMKENETLAKSPLEEEGLDDGEDEEDLLSPVPGDGDEEEPASYAEAAAKGTEQEGQAGSSGAGTSAGAGAGAGGGKKKNRRKKRKGGRS